MNLMRFQNVTVQSLSGTGALRVGANFFVSIPPVPEGSDLYDIVLEIPPNNLAR